MLKVHGKQLLHTEFDWLTAAPQFLSLVQQLLYVQLSQVTLSGEASTFVQLAVIPGHS